MAMFRFVDDLASAYRDSLGKNEAMTHYLLDVFREIGVIREDGGEGSGNWGHEGRPGKVGGSAPALIPTSIDHGWLYKPMDNSQIFENPIDYVGNDLAKEIINNVYGFRYQAVEEKMEDVDLSSLKSVQAFVTEHGLNSIREGAGDAYAVKFGDNVYLMDGNHRVARAKLDGKKTYRMNVIVFEKA